jgi:tRNA/rRNA methyltransferase/tRNA (cytidine32/uridine32-2'-O)-methyltransferase
LIVVVLDQPQELVNIAHVVRAMKNFDLADLRLVAPREYDPYRIEGIAHRTGDLLSRVVVTDTLESALADCVHVAACTARGRTAKRNQQRPREAADEILTRAAAGPVALVFGREDRGLANDALDRAHRVVTIPTSPAYPSLNLGHAAVLMFYELALARGAEGRPLKLPRRRAPAATAANLNQMFDDVAAAIEATGYFRNHQRALILRTLRGIAQRVPLDQREVKLLRALAIEARKAVDG